MSLLSKRSFLPGIVFGLLVLAFGLRYQFSEAIQMWPNVLIGDMGDGLFNLWVLRHNQWVFDTGQWDQLFQGRIFYPEHADSMLYSDTLYFPSLLFIVCSRFLPDPLQAYVFLAILLTIGAYAVYILFFSTVFSYVVMDPAKVGQDSQLQCIGFLLIPLFAYLATFSLGWNLASVHMQCYSSYFVILSVTGALRYYRTSQRRDLVLLLLGFTLVTYSTQYFAVMNAIYLLFLIPFFLLGWGLPRCMAALRDQWWVVLLGVASVFPLVWAYMQVLDGGGHPVGMRFELKYLIRPYHFNGFHAWLQSIVPFPKTDHEMPSYVGISLLFGLALLGLSNRDTLRSLGARLLRSPWFWVSVALLLYPIGNRVPLHQLWVARLVLLVYLGVCAFFMWRCALTLRDQGAPMMMVQIIGLMALTYMVTSGPSWRSGFESINISPWGVASSLVPGVTRIRAIGRLTALAYPFLLGIAFWGLGLLLQKEKLRLKRMLALGVTLALIGVQAWDIKGPLSLSGFTSEQLTLRATERKLFSEIQAPVLVLPFEPSFLTTQPMHLFLDLPHFVMLNGYSGREPELAHALVHLEGGDLARIQLAREKAGITSVVVLKNLYGGTRLASLKGRVRSAPVFENDRFYVFEVSDNEVGASAVERIL